MVLLLSKMSPDRLRLTLITWTTLVEEGGSIDYFSLLVTWTTRVVEG